MIKTTEKNYGRWPSCIDKALVAGKSPRIAEPRIRPETSGDHTIFWLQSLPEQKGRTTIMSQQVFKNGKTSLPKNLLARPLSVQSKVHEYGGGAYCLGTQDLFFILGEDQRIYKLNVKNNDSIPEPQPITPNTEGKLRFADLTYDANHNALLAICEDHSAITRSDPVQNKQEPAAKIVYIPLDDTHTHTGLRFLELPDADFYSNPSLSPCGKMLAYLSWNHPSMPWDATQLWVADISPQGATANARCIKGDTLSESIFQPRWSRNSNLYCVSDENNWWNIKALNKENIASPSSEKKCKDITSIEAEFATPQWMFAMSCYDLLDSDTILATYTQNGLWKAATISALENSVPTLEAQDAINEKFSDISAIHCSPSIANSHQNAVFIGANANEAPRVYYWNGDACIGLGHTPGVINERDISFPVPFKYDTAVQKSGEKLEAFGFYYAPANAQFESEDSSIKPPAIMLCHGGPTGATNTAFNPKIQYWTSRGFAVLDINYRGSTGYGRAYRHSLYKKWGVADVEDLCEAKKHAVKKGWVASDKCIIKGSSAGGYSVLAALTFTDTFDAGVSLYGIADLELLARDTHKFESRYMDNLIGPYPQEKRTYFDRSPIHMCEKISCPVLLFQGQQDKVVPPNQAKDIVKKLRAHKVPVTYITFENEGHGFRDASNIEKMLDVELNFYTQTFGLD